MLKVTNEELLVEIAESKRRGRATNKLGELCVSMATRLLRKPGFVSHNSYELEQDMLCEAIKTMLISYGKFDPTADDNAFAYLHAVARSAFIRVVHGENKERKIREDLQERVAWSKFWCLSNDIEFLSMSDDGERFKGYDPKQAAEHIETYKFTSYNYYEKIGKFSVGSND